jgi:hypothetical protein
VISICYSDSAPDCIATEVSEPFLARMVHRMVMSFYKYGPLADAYPSKIDALATMRRALDQYEADGNTERLVDAANYAMIEFMRPRHPKAHWTPTDGNGSFGRVWRTGHVGQDANTHAREVTRASRLYQRDGD